MSVICVYSCDTTELLASVVLQSLRVHKTTRSAALLIQSLAEGWDLSQPCWCCHYYYWFSFILNTALSPIGWCWVTPMLHSCGDCQLQLGVDGINEALRERWAGTRDWTCAVPEEMRLAQCVSVCFLAARKRSSSGLCLDFSFMCAIELNYISCRGQNHFPDI